MGGPVKIHEQMKESNHSNHFYDNNTTLGALTNKQRRQLQHEIKLHMEKYGRDLVRKASDYTKVTIWDDMMILRCEGFLTEPEKFVSAIPMGISLINESRMQIAEQFSKDNLPYFEDKLGAKCIHKSYVVESDKDFFIFTMVFDKMLIEIK
ncbi:Na-translocating system protein MpsC family protein [Bacillus sp. FJAT-29814]|uniref:Na-translocating system protein MpsC family protein n=1 Tax=Bacillus sp. FJAT-29814 TaxID=1729688 RepID=UPI00082EA217|nr:Na-translocating system protein MpsC family protein [Bacillus sp. FJAT-29814]